MSLCRIRLRGRSLRRRRTGYSNLKTNRQVFLDSSGSLGYNSHISDRLIFYTEEKGNGNCFTCTCIISIVIGVFSAGSLGWLGAVIGIIGIVIGIQGKKIPDQAGMAQGGIYLFYYRDGPLPPYIYCMCCLCGCLALLA